MAFDICLTSCTRLIFAISFLNLCCADPNIQINEERPQKWISEIMYEAEIKFDMVNNLVSEKCRNDFDIYKKHLSNQTIWAVRFLESSEWPKLSIFSGLTYHYGNFEECLKAQGPNIKGRYCLANIKYDFKYEDKEKEKHIWKVNPLENESAWKYVKRYESELTRLSRQSLTWALCIPSACSWDDLNLTLDNLITPIFHKYGLDVKTSVIPEYCQMRNEHNPPYSFHLIKYLFYIYLLFIVLATVYHLYSTNSNNHGEDELISNLSLIKSYQRLTRVNKNSPFNNVNFFKVMITIGTIMTHTKLFCVIFPTFDIEEFEMSNIFILKFLIINILDTIFFINGISFFLDQKWMEVPLNIFISIIGFKWISISLILLIGCIFLQYVLPFIGSSPIWNFEEQFLNTRKNSWLDTIFLVSNLMPTFIWSMPATWTVYVHFQIYLICGIFFVAFNKKWRIWSQLGALYIVSNMYTFMITLRFSENGQMVISPRITTQIGFWDMMWYPDGPFVHMNPINRINAVIIGCATALYVKDHSKKNYKNLSLIRMILGGAALYLFTWGSFLYFMSIIGDQRKVTILWKTIYFLLRPIIILIPAIYTAYFILKLDTIHSIKSLINLRLIATLARLCKALCIVSVTYQEYNQRRRTRIPSDNSTLYIIEKAISDVVMSLIISVFWYLIIEGPVTNFMDMLMKKFYRNRKSFNQNKLKM